MQLDEIPQSALADLLARERRAGTLWRRRFQTDALASAAALPQAFEILERATLEGDLDPAWLERLLAIHPTDALVALAGRRLDAMARSGDWTFTGLRLLDRVADLPAVPPWIAEAAVAALVNLAPPADGPVLVALIRLARSRDRQRVLSAIEPHWSVLSGITDPLDQGHLVRTFLDPDSGSLLPADLLDRRGLPRLAWLLDGPWSHRLLGSPALVGALAPECLVTLASACHDPDALQGWVYPALDDWMRRDAARTTAALIECGAWRPWRLRARPAAAPRQGLALRWLMDPAHGCRRSALATGVPVEWSALADQSAPCRSAPATMETWDQLMGDLVDALTGEVMDRITAPDTHWPPIHPFEGRQALDLAARAADLGALAVLADSLSMSEGLAFGLDLDGLIDASPFHGRIVAADLRWLCRSGPLVSARSAPPGLAESRLLCDQAGVRIAQALEARVAAVSDALDCNPGEALAAASSPPLWGDRGFRRQLRGRLGAIEDDSTLAHWGRLLEPMLVGVIHPQANGGEQRIGQTARLVRLGFPLTARLLADGDRP